MAYLKALGVLRLVSEDCEHGDTAARGFWRDDVFVLRSRFDASRLEEFFLTHYRPTPIVAPWAGGSGFFKKDNKEAVEKLATGSTERLGRYKAAIASVQKIIAEDHIDDKPKDEDKDRLIRRYRRELPDQVVSWMDAAMVLQQDGQSFAPILGTGGNDGRLDFTQNFMQRIVTLRLHENASPNNESRAWLAHALFGTPSRLSTASVGQFAPGRAGGPNATQGMEGDSSDNPWDFVLMMEGAIMFAGAAVRRLGSGSDARAAFPFTVRSVDVGFASAAQDESSDSRGELWLPLWDRPSSLTEIAALLAEGRAEVNGRPARDAVGVARAASTLGVDRGIAVFSRVGLLKRSGKSFLATPAGRLAVTERPHADLLCEIDPWLDSFRSACRSGNVPARFTAALRSIDAAVFDFCRYGGPAQFADILIALGKVERELARTPGKVGQSKIRVTPLAGLSAEWIDAARALDDREFEIALSLARVRAADGEQSKVGPLRSNLEPVVTWFDSDAQRAKADWAKKERAVVWNAADLATNLAAVLSRRCMDGARAGCVDLPLASPAPASLAAVSAFISGDLDDGLIEELLWGSILVEQTGPVTRPPPSADSSLPPRAYALLKLLFLPRRLVIEGEGDRRRARPARRDERGGIRIRPEPAILALLRAGRLGEACGIAMRRLRASGLNPLPAPIRGRRVRDGDWKELDGMGGAGLDARRLAAALLIPVRDSEVNRVFHLATRGGDAEPQETAAPVAAEGD